MRNGMPGIGGSLGSCAFCGKIFMAEILMGTRCITFEIAQVAGPLAAHKKCMAEHESKTSILEWPEESPVRKAILAHNAEKDSKDVLVTGGAP